MTMAKHGPERLRKSDTKYMSVLPKHIKNLRNLNEADFIMLYSYFFTKVYLSDVYKIIPNLPPLLTLPLRLLCQTTVWILQILFCAILSSLSFHLYLLNFMRKFTVTLLQLPSCYRTFISMSVAGKFLSSIMAVASRSQWRSDWASSRYSSHLSCLSWHTPHTTPPITLSQPWPTEIHIV